MSDPLIDPSDLGVYLNDTTINDARAEMMIGYAQTLCETICSPLPATAAGIVMRVAARGYVSTTSTRNAQLAAAGSPFGGGGVVAWLTRADKADLRRLSASGGSAFTVSMIPATFGTNLSPWDTNGDGTVFTS